MRVQLSLHANDLKNVAGAFKGTSDPFAVVTRLAMTSGVEPEVLGKTEVVNNSLSPRWTKMFIFDYELGKPMHIAVSIYDEVKKGDNKSMGSAIFELGAILGSRGNVMAKKIKGGGTLFAHLEKNEGSGTLRLQLRGTKLKNTEGFMKKSDPFFELSRNQGSAGGISWDNVYCSKPVKDNLDPLWDDAIVDLSVLCSGDLDKPLKISVYDYESDGDHKLMGEFETTVNGLLAAKSQGENGGFTMKKKGKDTGKISVLKAEVVGVEQLSQKMTAMSVQSAAPTAAVIPQGSRPTFVDYISGGCDLSVCVAIDFTGSNGDPRIPGTLHYINRDGSKNDYEKAIHAICSILANYDSNKKFPVFGFGAKYGGIVRHCFQCGPKAEVDGVEGIIQAYRDVFKSGLIMSGPTVFTEVIQTAAARALSAQEAAKQKGEQAYTILLILTDGSVSDVNATADCLNQVSDSPLSIVIVGVGRDDFSAMKFLDDFKGKRDIAQFVEFNRHKESKQSLTSATLDEIPNQLVGYFTSKGIKPLPPVQKRDEDIVVGTEEEIDLSLAFDGDDGEIVVSGGGRYSGDAF